jgi:hypothetical protein
VEGEERFRRSMHTDSSESIISMRRPCENFYAGSRSGTSHHSNAGLDGAEMPSFVMQMGRIEAQCAWMDCTSFCEDVAVSGFAMEAERTWLL